MWKGGSRRLKPSRISHPFPWIIPLSGNSSLWGWVAGPVLGPPDLGLDLAP